jgi:O-antigen/teichoic acid export membrane protein
MLILLMSIYMLWRQFGVADLLLVVVIAQGIGMIVALVILAATRLLAAPQVAAPLALKKLFRGALPFFGLSLNDVLLQRIDILLLSFFGDARLLGAYSAAYNLVRVAIKVLQSVWRGVYPTLARLHPSSPAQAAKVATRLFYLGFALCTIGALFVSVFATPILRLVYGVGEESSGNGEVATILSWLIWQAPLFFVELYASTWLMVIARAGVAFGLALLHLCLLLVLLPLGAAFAGAIGAAWGTLAAQALAATAALWLMRAQQGHTSSRSGET